MSTKGLKQDLFRPVCTLPVSFDFWLLSRPLSTREMMGNSLTPLLRKGGLSPSFVTSTDLRKEDRSEVSWSRMVPFTSKIEYHSHKREGMDFSDVVLIPSRSSCFLLESLCSFGLYQLQLVRSNPNHDGMI